MRRPARALAFAAVLTLGSTNAWAEPAPNPEAVKHFLEGKRLRDENRCTEAIVELEASVRIEKSIGAYYNLGVCFEKIGNKRRALASYSSALDLAKQRKDDREREIRAQLSEFLEKTPHIRLALPQPMPDDLRITVDGDLIPPSDLQTETKYFVKGNRPSYEVIVTAPGYEETRLVVDAATAKKQDLVTIVLQKSGDAAPPAPIARAEDPGFTWQHWTGIGLAGAGVVVLGVSAYFFIDYLGDRSDLDRKLTEHPCHNGADPTKCEPGDFPAGANEAAGKDDFNRLVEENNDLESRIKVTGIGTAVVGGLLVVGGLVVYLTAPRASADPAAASSSAATTAPTFHVVPRFGRSQQGLAVVGTF